MDFDEFLSAIGGFGTYQRVVLYLVLLPAVLPCAFHAYNQIFMSARPEHWCRVAALEDLGYSPEFARNVSIPVEDGGGFSECTAYDRDYAADVWTGNRTTGCSSGWVYDRSRYEETIVTEWNLVCDRDDYPTIALVIFGAGGFLGNLVFGYVQDSFGRRPAFFAYLLIETAFGIASAFAGSFAAWTVLRFGVGFTVPAILGTPYVLSVELVTPERRAYCTILINVMYSVGLVSLAGVAYLVRDWRRLTLVTTLPFAAFLLYWWVLPESPRWLVANGKFEEAEKVLRRMAEVNGKTWPEESLKENPSFRVSREGDSEIRYGITDLFRYPALRLKTIIITFIWFTNTAVYVGLSYYTPNLGGDEFFNFFLSGAVELPTYLFLLHAIEKGGRRWTLCVSMIVGGIACLGTVASDEAEPVLIALYCIGKMGISCSFVVVPLLASELYPTVVRGIGMSFSSVIGQLGPIVIPLVNRAGKDRMTLPLLIMGVISVVGGALSLLLPETVNLRLPQNLEEGDKRNARSSSDSFSNSKIHS